MVAIENKNIQAENETAEPEVLAEKAGFINRMREVLAKEAKLTFSLPAYGKVFDSLVKANAAVLVPVATKVAIAQQHNELLSTGVEKAATTGAASSFALLGVITLLAANRVHEENDRQWAEVQETADAHLVSAGR